MKIKVLRSFDLKQFWTVLSFKLNKHIVFGEGPFIKLYIKFSDKFCTNLSQEDDSVRFIMFNKISHQLACCQCQKYTVKICSSRMYHIFNVIISAEDAYTHFLSPSK